jgi:hypothetical protein
MCSSDISVIVWQWNYEEQRAQAQADVVHTCRNFEKILGWAREHKAKVQFDAEVFIQDDIRVSDTFMKYHNTHVL